MYWFLTDMRHALNFLAPLKVCFSGSSKVSPAPHAFSCRLELFGWHPRPMKLAGGMRSASHISCRASLLRRYTAPAQCCTKARQLRAYKCFALQHKCCSSWTEVHSSVSPRISPHTRNLPPHQNSLSSVEDCKRRRSSM